MRYLYIFILILFSAMLTQAQDATFSQYYSSGLYLNPALASQENDITFSTNYRTQWRNVVVPYSTSQMSFIYPFYNKNIEPRKIGAFGLSVYNDKAGDGNFKTLGVSGTFAYNLPLNFTRTHQIDMAGQVGFIQKRVDFTNLQWGQQFNPFIGFDAATTPDEPIIGSGSFYADINMGVLYHFNAAQDYRSYKMSGFLGLAGYHINSPDESFIESNISKLPVLYKAHGGLEFALNNKVRLAPNFLALLQNQQNQINTGMYVSYRMTGAEQPSYLTKNMDLVVGGWYRFDDAVIAMIGLSTPYYTLGVSYDYNSSGLRFATRGRGAYEVSLTLRRVKNQSLKRIATPRI